MSWLKFAVGENLSLMLFFSAHGLTTAMKSSDCWPVKPYMISMLLLLLLPPPPPPLLPLLRQPVVRTATAPRTAVAVRLDLMRMALLLTLLGRGIAGTRWSTGSGSGGCGGATGAGGWPVTGHPETGVGGEDVRVLDGDPHVHRLALHRWLPGVDAQGDQLLGGAVGRRAGPHGAVGVGVGAEFLDDD